MANTVIIVSQVQGQAWVRTENGSLRALRPGMRIPVDAEIVTAEGARVSLQGDESGQLQIADNQQITLTPDLFEAADRDEAAIAEPAQQDVQALITALNAGQDPLEELDPTEAIVDGGDGAGGTYVRLANVIETTTPMDLAYPRGSAAQRDNQRVGGVSDSAAPQIDVEDSDGDVSPASNSVVEASPVPATGSISIATSVGLAAITVNGVNVTNASAAAPVAIQTDKGTLLILGLEGGVLRYSYTDNGTAKDHSQGKVQEVFQVTVRDVAGKSSSANLTIEILDTEPEAKDDTAAITEDAAAPVTGNVLGNDEQRADAIESVVFASTAAKYGTLTVNPDGSWSYTLNSQLQEVQALNDGQTLTESFTYTITDADGDESTATLTIVINGQTDAAPVVTSQNHSVVEASSGVITGDMTVSAEAGFAAVTVNGQNIQDASAASPVVITTANGELRITGFDTATGKISYSYTENGTAKNHSVGQVIDQFDVKVTDYAGKTANGVLAVEILDTGPVARDDTAEITEDAALPVSGNVLGNDEQRADAIQTIVFANTQAQYGTLTVDAQGNWQYTLNTRLPAVQALNDGQTLTESFTYTITDADGDESTATLTIVINGQTDAPPQIQAQAQSVVEGSGVTISESVLITAEAGVAEVLVNGQNVMQASAQNPLVISTANGELRITGYNAATGVLSYSYTENGQAKDHSAGDVIDSFDVTVKDVAGVSVTDKLNVQILDTEPQAQDDTAEITEDAALPVSGNVLGNDDERADAIESVVFASTAAKYGTLTVNPDGSWSYTLNSQLQEVQALNDGQTLTESFTYTITDADGDESTATLTIVINGQTDAPPQIQAQAQSVVEGSGVTISESVQITAEAGVAEVLVNGQNVMQASAQNPLVISTANGELRITGYNAATGVLSYSYTENGQAKDHSAGDVIDSFDVTVKDVAGVSVTDKLNVQILDTEPQAQDDTAEITEDAAAPVTGNVLGNDEQRADAIESVVFASTAAKYGTLTVNPDGSWSYTLNSQLQEVQALNDGQTLTESFTYTITDADGDESTATLTIVINGQTDAAPVVTSQNHSVVEASSGVITGDMTVSAEAGFAAVTVNGQNIQDASAASPVVITTANGELRITGFDTATGKISYSYSENGTAKNHSVGQVIDQFDVKVTDYAGKTANGVLAVEILDTVPVAKDESAQLGEDDALPVKGNVLDNDVPGADVIKTVVFESTLAKYGTLTVDAQGNWQYTLNTRLPAVQALNDGQTLTESFTYTITDADGDESTATLTIVINGKNDAPPQIQAQAQSVVEGSGVTISESVLITAEAGVAEVLVNGQNVMQASVQNPLVISTANGELRITGYNAATGVLSYSYTENGQAKNHSAGDVIDAFNVTVKDLAGVSVTEKLNVQILDTEPVARDDAGKINELDTVPISGNVLDNDDRPADAVTLNFHSTAAKYGTLTVGPDGSWKYQLNNDHPDVKALGNGQSLQETFTYTVTDADGDKSTANLVITIEGSNDAPVARADTMVLSEDGYGGTASLNGNQTVNIGADGYFHGNLLANDTNPEGALSVVEFRIGNLVYQAGSGYVNIVSPTGKVIGEIAIETNGNYSFKPAPNYSGSIPEITYVAREADNGIEDGKQTQSSLNITVKPVADAPVIEVSNAPSVLEDSQTGASADNGLALNLPQLVDVEDLNGATDGDNPELMGVITLVFKTTGATAANPAKLLIDGQDDVSITANNQQVKIVIVDDNGNPVGHIANALQQPGVIALTREQYESLQVKPAANTHNNITVQVSATSYEVDAAGNPLAGVPGATTTKDVSINVLAVTDDVSLGWKNPDPDNSKLMKTSINEDAQVNIKTMLQAAFNDLDGSEKREILIENTSGVDIKVGNTVLGAGKTMVVGTGSLGTSESGFPDIKIGGISNFSGTLSGIKIILRAQDIDNDSPDHVTQVKTDEVYLDLEVRPVADNLNIKSFSMAEDATVKLFDKNITFIDNDGSEGVQYLAMKGVPSGWVILDGQGQVVAPSSVDADGKATYVFVNLSGDNAMSVSDFNTAFAGYTITPPRQSSVDANIKVDYVVRDVSGDDVHENVRNDVNLKISVTPVAEKVGDKDSDGNFNNDLQMTEGHKYSDTVVGKEDEWFDLNVDGFNLKDGWFNPDTDGSEKTYALLTPILVNGPVAGVAGSQFSYIDGNGTEHVLTYTGQAVRIPMEFLDTLKFKAPENSKGEFKIKVQAYTEDKDSDSGAQNTATSGEAYLSNIRIAPDADELTADAVAISSASGLEDTEIRLSIRPSSSDQSEKFNVKIDEIPDGATIRYNGISIQSDTPSSDKFVVEIHPDGSWSVIIVDFKSSLDTYVIPPLNSNENFDLKVSAQSVDSAAGFDPSQSAFSPVKNLPVSVRGVADEVEIDPRLVEMTEAQLDQSGHRINLSDMVSRVQPFDADGSETDSYKITGLPEGFTLEGATLFQAGKGTERVWFVQSASELLNVKVVAPANYSGELNFKVIAVTTENDGDWKEGAPVDLKAVIQPSPDSEGVSQSVVVEDGTQQITFGIADNNGDANEYISAVYISQEDIVGQGFTLYLNGVPLTEYASLLENGYYKLTGAQIQGVTGKADTPHFAHKPGDTPFKFGVKYDVVDPSNDGKVDAVTETREYDYQLYIKPVTDTASAQVTGIGNATLPPGEFEVDGNAVTVGGIGDFDVKFQISTDDIDGSEQLIQVIVEGIPNGLVINHLSIDGQPLGSVSFIGDNQWLIQIKPEDVRNLGSGKLDAAINFHVGDDLEKQDGTRIVIRPVTKDPGADNVSSAEVEWQLFTPDMSGPPTEAVIEQSFKENPSFSATEDQPFKLSEAFDVGLKVNAEPQEVQFSLKLSIPEGTVIKLNGEVLEPTVIGGQADPDQPSVWVITGTGGEADIKALLDSLEITPPPNVNDNFGGLKYEATLTSFHQDTGAQQQVYHKDSLSVKPVTDTDGIQIEITGAGTHDTPHEGQAVDIRIKIGNGVDGGSVLGEDIYIKVNTTFTQDGVLKDAAGNVLSLVTVEAGNPLGLAPGQYYKLPVAEQVLPGGSPGSEMVLTYTPSPAEAFTAGQINVQAWVQKSETGASNTLVAEGSRHSVMEGVSNGYDIVVPETINGVEGQRVEIDIAGAGLLDAVDGSETVFMVLFKNLPSGFTVYAGETSATAEVVANGGELAHGGAVWLIPVGADGQLPAYIAVKPPSYWSGDLPDLEITVFSGEKDGSSAPVQDSATFKLHFEAKANGVYTIQDTEAFGREGMVIALNLSVLMMDSSAVKLPGLPEDSDYGKDSSVETVSLRFGGIGEHAAFYVGSELLSFNGADKGFSYDAATGTYLVYGLTQSEVDALGVFQTANALPNQIQFEAWTVESSNGDVSESKNGLIDLTLTKQDITGGNGADQFLFDGQSVFNGGDGEDTVYLRFGEDLDFEGTAMSEKFRNIEVLDLTRDGFDHSITQLGVDDVLSMTDSRNVLTILANEGDAVAFDTKDTWKLNAEKSATGDFDVYEGTAQNGQKVEVRVSKGFDGISGAESGASQTMDASSFGIDADLQQQITQQIIDAGKNNLA